MVNVPSPVEWSAPEKLSAYDLFEGAPKQQRPKAGVVPYDLNTPLFSDYAVKHRFIRLPAGKAAHYRDDDSFDFPEGTVIIKTFAFAHDLADPSKGERLIETRILLSRPEGWIGLPYIWNAEQTEATLDLAGGTVDVAWKHTDGKNRTVNYIVPNANQCKSCHDRNKKMQPIGPKARHLNKQFAYADGTENQLEHWSKLGMLNGTPSTSSIPKCAVWSDSTSGSLDERARAWLDINCAHCHQPGGSAAQSGLDLSYSQRDRTKRGVWKLPVAAGRGSGGRAHDIVPGKPDASIMVFRLESTEPGIMMPELPRRLVDVDGVQLIRQWIAQLSEK